jgi:ferredoxin-NADP reductase
MPEYEMTLVDQQRIARDTMAFWFDTNGASFGFRAGQHADFVFKHPRTEGVSDNSRTLSLASSPHDKRPVMIAMRMRKTPFKTALKSAALGTKFIVSRPRGSFTLHRDITRPAVFLAGASGFRPFAASFGRPLRNVFHTDCICSIRTGRRTTRRSSKNLKI